MKEPNAEKKIPVEIKGGTRGKTENETLYMLKEKKLDGGIYESVTYVIDDETRAVTKITSWTKGEGENFEAVEMDGNFLKKEKLGYGEIKIDEGYPDMTLKLVLDIPPTD